MAPFGDQDESSGLPALLTSLVGRERETASLSALLRDPAVRLATLTGVGGVGKTRLAVHVAEELTAEFADGIHFVPLAAITDAALVLPTVARSLGLVERGRRSLVAQLRAFLAPRELLLVLDNLEQVLAVGPALVELLAASPRVIILTTSRAPLRVSGEHIFPVVPLGLPAIAAADHPALPPERQLEAVASSDAGRLFLVRAQAVDPGLRLTESNAAAIAAICQRLEGLPLALELAAARSAVFAPAALLARLARRLPLLVGGPRDQPARLRTMRDAIAWSYDLLTAQEQAVFRRLAIFVGGFTLEAAEAVIGDEVTAPSVVEVVAALVAQSLLRRDDPGAADAGTQPRFSMLETIREFGLEQLTTSGESETIQRRHADWCIALVERTKRSGGFSQARGLAAITVEHPNVRAALSLLLEHDVAAALHLTGLLSEFWLRNEHLDEGTAWLERALAADRGEPTAARAEALVGLAMLLWPRNEHERSVAVLGEAEIAARQAADERVLAYVRLNEGYLAAIRHDVDLVVLRGEESAAYFAAIGDPVNLDGALWLLAMAALMRDDVEQSAALFERLLSAAHGWGDEVSIANSHVGLAILAQRRGEMRAALAGYAEAAALYKGFGSEWPVSHCLDQAAIAAMALGESMAAVRLFAAADALRKEIGAAPDFAFELDRDIRERALARARASLGSERFAVEWSAGLAISAEEAVAEILALAQSQHDHAARPATSRDEGDAHLSAREREVLRRLAGGESDKEIAAALGITRRTASNHVAAILTKLGVPSRTAAAVIALRDRLI